jgi:hypothetical protein
MPTVGVDRFEDDRAARHMVSHTVEMMPVALNAIWGRVVDRHPRLRVGFLESGSGWIAPRLDRMDRQRATDYPHSDGFFPGAPQMLRERLGTLSSEAQRQVLAGGALGFYGLS